MTEYIPIFSFIKRRNLAVTPVYSYKEYQKVLRFDKHPIKIITEHLGVAFIDKAFTTNKERSLDRTFSGLL